MNGSKETNWNIASTTLAACSDYLIPQSKTAAVISAGAAWYTYQYIMTYSQQMMAELITQKFKGTLGETLGGTLGHLSAPLIVPEASPYFAGQLSVAVAFATSLTLNLLARGIFGKFKKKAEGALIKSASYGGNPTEASIKGRAESKTSQIVAKQLNEKQIAPPVPKIDTPSIASPSQTARQIFGKEDKWQWEKVLGGVWSTLTNWGCIDPKKI